jgi:hypothetical protein
MTSPKTLAPQAIPPNKAHIFLEELSTSAIASVDMNNIPQALQLLGKSQELIEALLSQGQEVNEDYVLLTLHSTAYAYQK